MFSFTDNHKSIKEINTMFSTGTLIVDETYQRRSVWGEKDKIRLIETILLKLVIPEVFFWKAETDPETGESITHIVDGQQRIKAIVSFIDNEYKLKKQYLLDEDIKEKYGNKFFKDLDPIIKTAFWNYRLMIIEIGQESTKNDIVQVFRRLNLTDFNLNDQEKRNSISGDFAALARDLSEEQIWDKKHLFNNTDIKRMKDVEFCGTLILLYRQGIIDQTDQKPLNQAYEDLQSGYDDAESDKENICQAIAELENFINEDDILKFVKRKAQLYTLFSVIFYMQRENIKIKDLHVKKLNDFVKLYSVFDNDLDMDGKLDEKEKTLYDMLKKYKLASSEGLNKHTNRMIRFTVMRDFLCNEDNNLTQIQNSLYKKMEDFQIKRSANQLMTSTNSNNSNDITIANN